MITSPYYWLAALGLTCLASSVAFRRRQDPLPLPERLGQYADDFQVRVYD